MIDYGYVPMLKTALRLFEDMSRGTGRTEYLLDVVQAGDRIVVGTEMERRRLENLLRETGKRDVEVCAVNVDSRDKWKHRLAMLSASRPLRPTLFDHTFVMALVEMQIMSFTGLSEASALVNRHPVKKRPDIDYEPLHPGRIDFQS